MKTAAEIRQYFATTIVGHQRLNDVHALAMHHIANAVPGKIMMIVGPSGVGKSLTARLCIEDCVESLRQQTKPVQTPPVHIDIPVGVDGRFARRGLYEEILYALQEPVVAGKQSIDHRVERLQSASETGRRTDSTAPRIDARRIDALGQSVNRACNHRKPVALILDEAGHLVTTANARVQSKNLDVIKWHSNQVATPIILIGGYDDHHMLEVSAQLANRVDLVVFSRYRERVEEIDYFTDIWRKLEDDLQFPFAQKINSESDYVYTHTLGCVGILMSWFRDALAHAAQDGSRSLKKSHLDAHRKSNIQLQGMARTIDRMEPVYLDSGEFERELCQADWTTDPPKQKKNNGRKRPGDRNAVRDRYESRGLQ